MMPAPEARVVKWQTRTFEGRMPKGMGVQVPPRAPLPLQGNEKQEASGKLSWMPNLFHPRLAGSFWIHTTFSL